MIEQGILYIVGTPIGNLKDITLRGLETLESVDLIACEDTRHTIKLLNHFDISKKLVSYHEHNKHSKAEELVQNLLNGKNIALVSDAGMPCISDPGFELVVLAKRNNIKVTTIPSGTAVVSGLILSGANPHKYIFEGFLSRDKKERRTTLESFEKETRTLVLYESPHHIKVTLKDLSNYVHNRKVSIVREITKIYEQSLTGTCDELLSYFNETQPKGEMVVVIEGKDKNELVTEKQDEFKQMSVEEHYEIYISQGMNYKEAMKKVAKDRGLQKREIYNIINKK